MVSGEQLAWRPSRLTGAKGRPEAKVAGALRRKLIAAASAGERAQGWPREGLGEEGGWGEGQESEKEQVEEDEAAQEEQEEGEGELEMGKLEGAFLSCFLSASCYSACQKKSK